jgi:hypothetical protein
MSDFVTDGSTLPTNKVDARPPVGPVTQQMKAAEWNAVNKAAMDLRTHVVAIEASMGLNTSDVTLTSVGASPSASGATLSGQVLTLQPADATHPGLVTANAQTLAGTKTFANTILSSVASGSDAFQALTGARLHLGNGSSDYLYSNGFSLVTCAGDLAAVSSLTSSALFAWQNTTLNIAGQSPDSGGAVGIILCNHTFLTTPGARLVSIQNGAGGLEVANVDLVGRFNSAATGSAFHATVGYFTSDQVVGQTAFYTPYGGNWNGGPYPCSQITDVASTGTAIASLINTTASLVTPGDKLLVIKNNNVEKFSVDKDGAVTAGDITAFANLWLNNTTCGLHNNAGFLQVRSTAGYMYGDFGTGLVPMAFGGSLDFQYTPTGNVGTGEDTLLTFTLPANALSTQRVVCHHASGITANNANAKTLKVYFGAQTISATLTTSIAADWTVDAKIYCTGANTQRYVVKVQEVDQATGTTKSFVAQGTLSEVTSGTIVIKLTGTATSNNDIVQNTSLISAL